MENSSSVKLPLNRKREYLSRCVKSQILKRKGRKKRWLQGLPKLEQVQTVKEKKIKIKVKVKGKKRGRKPLSKLELSYPDNEMYLTEEEAAIEKKMDTDDEEQDMPCIDGELENKQEQKGNELEHLNEPSRENGDTSSVCGSSSSEKIQEESQTQIETKLSENPRYEADVPAIEANPEVDGPLLELMDCPVELLHSYSLNSKKLEGEKPPSPESQPPEEVNGNAEQEPQPQVETEVPKTEVSRFFFTYPNGYHIIICIEEIYQLTESAAFQLG